LVSACDLDVEVPLLCAPTPPVIPTFGPSPREGFVGVYSRSAGGVFVVGGADSVTGTNLNEIWFSPILGAWQKFAMPNYVLGHVQAAAFSFADRHLWVLDSSPDALGITWMRLSRIAAFGSTVDTIATWPSLGLATAWFLTIDQDGALLITSTSAALGSSLTERLEVSGPLNLVTEIFSDPGALVAAPVVDMNGYSYVVAGPVAGSLRVHRFASLGGAPLLSNTLAQLSLLEQCGL
jgi:hypothetical protein